jgi:hypothetical protein
MLRTERRSPHSPSGKGFPLVNSRPICPGPGGGVRKRSRPQTVVVPDGCVGADGNPGNSSSSLSGMESVGEAHWARALMSDFRVQRYLRLT